MGVHLPKTADRGCRSRHSKHPVGTSELASHNIYILKIETEEDNDKDGKFSNREPLFQVSRISSS
jgi:hypothetical protein